MSSRTALVLETNPVITERYLDYTSDSTWRIMLKDTLNDFLEKLQHDQFDLVVAEESILPQAIIQMMKSIGVPFLLSSNNKNPEIPTIPRNFNRTELLTVFDRLVPDIKVEEAPQDTPKDEGAAKELFSGLEDEDEETFELTSDAVILDPGKTHGEETEENKTSENPFEISDNDGETDLFFRDDDDSVMSGKPFEFRPEITETAMNPLQSEPETEEKPEETVSERPEEPEEEESVEAEKTVAEQYAPAENGTDADSADDAVKAAVKEWLDKNARSIIKEIVLEQLISLSGKNND